MGGRNLAFFVESSGRPQPATKSGLEPPVSYLLATQHLQAPHRRCTARSMGQWGGAGPTLMACSGATREVEGGGWQGEGQG